MRFMNHECGNYVIELPLIGPTLENALCDRRWRSRMVGILPRIIHRTGEDEACEPWSGSVGVVQTRVRQHRRLQEMSRMCGLPEHVLLVLFDMRS